MKKLIAVALATTLGLTVSPAVLAKNAPQQTVNVKFKKGASSAKYTGQIKGSNYNQYKFYAKKGQKLKVTLNGGSAEPYLFGSKIADSVYLDKNSPDLNDDGTYTLPATGTYELRITHPKAMKIKNKLSKYTVTIAIR